MTIHCQGCNRDVMRSPSPHLFSCSPECKQFRSLVDMVSIVSQEQIGLFAVRVDHSNSQVYLVDRKSIANLYKLKPNDQQIVVEHFHAGEDGQVDKARSTAILVTRFRPIPSS